MIAIPNIDMPKRCELCPCSYYSEGALSDICQVTDKPITDGKPTDCPLIEIVTCGECKHYAFGSCSKLHLVTDPENFCSDGERRNDDHI